MQEPFWPLDHSWVQPRFNEQQARTIWLYLSFPIPSIGVAPAVMISRGAAIAAERILFLALP